MTRRESGDERRQQRVTGEDGDDASDNQRDVDDGGEEELDLAHMPPIEELENLILEAYNNMQSDGEFIFLPDEVAQKLHLVAQMVRIYVNRDGEGTTNADFHLLLRAD